MLKCRVGLSLAECSPAFVLVTGLVFHQLYRGAVAALPLSHERLFPLHCHSTVKVGLAGTQQLIPWKLVQRFQVGGGEII